MSPKTSGKAVMKAGSKRTLETDKTDKKKKHKRKKAMLSITTKY